MKLHTPFTQRLGRWIGASLMALSLAGQTQAQSPPSDRPITIVVGFAPGAGTDTLARALGEQLSQRLKRPVIVDNKPGAGGAIAVANVAKATADGSTLLFAPNTLVIAPHVQPPGGATSVNVLTELTPIVQVTRSTLVIVTNPASGVKDVKALTALARAKPGQSFGTAGNGSPQHIVGVLFGQSAGVEVTHIPYRGTGPALVDLLGGQLSFAVSSLGAAIPYIQSGKLVAIAVPEKNRTPLLPDVPTLTEQGVRNVELSGWFGLLAPRGTPSGQVEALNREINAILASPDIQQKFKAQGEVPVGGTTRAFAQLVKDEYAIYGKIVKDFSIKSE